MRMAILLAGGGQLALALASLGIPRVLGWREETGKLKRLTRQVFWTYAGYIWGSHVAFGLLSLFAPDSLIGHTRLAGAVTAFIALWWSARLVLQFACFDRSARPPGAIYLLAETALVALFAANAVLYSLAAGLNFRGAR